MNTLFVSLIAIFNTYLMGFQIILDDINESVQDLFEQIDKEIIEAMSEIQGAPEYKRNVKDVLFFKFLKQKLAALIRKHADALNHLSQLKTFFEISFLFMFYGQLVTMGTGIVYLTWRKSSYNILLPLVGCLVTITVECFWYCRMIEKLSDANNNIGDSLYNLDWPQRLCYKPAIRKDYREIRTTFLIILTNSQQNIDISCGGLFNMSLAAFAEFLNMVYNLFMFFLTVI
ncbi:uncharacterized protein LOC131428192 [Malaya genurostris]|uniref:uncharacterized protein LOC131428183 n=1 Tax=Malaya genurostris TaxID=325434 RepID=UPI0026F3CDC6|nr:uncharacterized protein LOC131428183 [Malaya genurostris]XP_058447905.1 uncharacterized protein LOC131428192 [Malaya genurostris]